MENEVILKIENLSKQYRLGTIGTGTVSHDLNRFFAKIRGKEDPFLKVGESNNRAAKATSQYVWALKNLNFEVKRGEVLGIIGKNGAGKSTLLKILSKVTGPTTGVIKSKGRIASLLEVGTGFHPEMTGKENIFLNGAILGMTKNEIASKLNEIIEFSGCERYINTPVKRYSSGMKVRLAFAVAAFLEPDILVVDEVLAVGDAEFQKKAIGKMQDISNTDGRTVLFVSHDMVAVQNLCEKVVIIKNGCISFIGEAKKGVGIYINENYEEVNKVKLSTRKDRKGNGVFKFEDVVVNNNKPVLITSKIEIEIFYSSNVVLENLNLALTICKNYEEKIMTIDNFYQGEVLKIDNARGSIKLTIPKLNLLAGNYSINLWSANNGDVLDYIINAFSLNIEEEDIYGTGKVPNSNKHGVFYSEKAKWEIN